MIEFEPACSQMNEVLSGIGEEALTRASPCTDYSVGDLIDHVDQVARLFTALARHDPGEMANTPADPRTEHLGPEWKDTVPQHVWILGQAWHDSAAWQGDAPLPGDLSNQTWGKIALTELVVHGWDIARATDQPFDLSEDTLRPCLDHVTAFLPGSPFPALWGPATQVAAGATLLDQIVAVTGRTP
jgi:uncharacterized protein (TIGR03086 family)